MSSPLCSILITTRNGGSRGLKYGAGKWLRDAINSALAQTYPELEICINDDGSDDMITWSILQKYARLGSGPRIKVRRSPPEGIPFGFNNAFDMSSGEWVFPMGDDDLLSPHYVEHILEHVERKLELKDYSLDLCGTWIDEITPEGLFWNKLAGAETEPSKIRICMDRNRFECGVLASRRAAWETIGGYPEDMALGSDYGYALTALEKKLLIGCVPECLYYYRSTHAGNRDNSTWKNKPEHLRLVLERFEIYRRRANPFFERNIEYGLLSPTVARRNHKESLRV